MTAERRISRDGCEQLWLALDRMQRRGIDPVSAPERDQPWILASERFVGAREDALGRTREIVGPPSSHAVAQQHIGVVERVRTDPPVACVGGGSRRCRAEWERRESVVNPLQHVLHRASTETLAADNQSPAAEFGGADEISELQHALRAAVWDGHGARQDVRITAVTESDEVALLCHQL